MGLVLIFSYHPISLLYSDEIKTMSENRRLYQTIGKKLKNLITTEDYPVGSRLLPERDIAERFDVSRTVVREALIMLELEGLIEIKKGSGVYVLNHPLTQDDRDSMDYGPFEVLQARQFIESAIIGCVATHITKADIIEMRQVLADEKQSIQEGGTGEENDLRFHYLIAKSSQNCMMLEVLEKMWHARLNSPMWQKLHDHIEDKNYRNQWLLDHENILNALQKRDPIQARQAMWQHLENVKNTLMTLSDVDDPNFDGYLFQSIPYESVFE